MKITFHGGALSVTGANYLLEHPSTGSGQVTKILVDCGLAQGSKYAEDLNYEDFKYNPKEIDVVFVTHSHIDHIGRMAKLYKDGFRGRVIATTATLDLMKVALPDNARHIINEAKDDGHEPLFTQDDTTGLMTLGEGYLYGQDIKIKDSITAVLHDAGHILGSATIEIKWTDDDGTFKNILFSGDLGNSPTPLLRDTEYIGNATYVVTESTYGDRIHEARQESKKKLIKVIIETIKRKGVLMIPSFAMERTQELLYEFNEICESSIVPHVPFFIDSPLAIKITRVYKQHSEYFNKKTNYDIKTGDDIFNFPGLTMTRTTEQSKKINDVQCPKIIMAGSGMSHGGRIVHHEKRYLGDSNNTLLFVGYQAEGSLGRRIQREDKQVTILGTKVLVKAHLETIGGYSAHADQPMLLKWVKATNSKGNLKRVFVVQGEENSSNALAELIRQDVDVDAIVPKPHDFFEL